MRGWLALGHDAYLNAEVLEVAAGLRTEVEGHGIVSGAGMFEGALAVEVGVVGVAAY